jgi:WD40 repeat protein
MVEIMNEANNLYETSNQRAPGQLSGDSFHQKQSALLDGGDMTGILKPEYMSKDQKDEEITELPTVVKSKMIAHSGACTALTFNVNGDTLATAGSDKQVKLWGIKKKSVNDTMSLKNKLHSVCAIAFSLDNVHLMACTTDHKATLYNLKG